MKPLGDKWLVKLYDHVCSNPAIIGRRTFAPIFLKCESTFAPLITNPFALRILPYLYFHRRFIEPFCASTFCMYMYYRVSTFYSSHPSIFVFLDAIWQIQTVNYIRIRNISDVAPVKNWQGATWLCLTCGGSTVRTDNEGKIYPLGTNIRLKRTCKHLLFIMWTVIIRMYIVLFPIVLN
jgi:hypothetical protein